MRRSRWWGVLGVVVFGLTAAGCTGDGDGKPTPSSTSRSPVTGSTPVVAVNAPDGGQLRVVEQGMSPITDRGQAMVSFGVILDSTSTDWIATGAHVTVTFTDASGKRIDEKVDHGQFTVATAFPHARTSLAGQVYVDAPGATRIQVRMGSTTWLPRVGSSLVQLTASDVRTRRRFEYTLFSFELMSSGADRAVNGMFVNIIFRDRDGRVIGGTGRLGGSPRCSRVPPGRSDCSLSTIYPLPAGVVDARTEVYVNGV